MTRRIFDISIALVSITIVVLAATWPVEAEDTLAPAAQSIAQR